MLSDRDIRAALQSGRVRIDPYDSSCLQPSSVDLHLDSEFRVFRNNRYPFIDVRAPQPDLTELVTVTDDEPFILHPGEFVLGQTLEWIELPDDISTVVSARRTCSAGMVMPRMTVVVPSSLRIGVSPVEIAPSLVSSLTSVAIFSDMQIGRDEEAMTLVAITVVLAFAALWTVEALLRRGRRRS